MIETFIPEEHFRLVRGILKEERYQKNKKLKEKIIRRNEYLAKVDKKKEKIVEKADKEDKNLLLKFDNKEQQFHFIENQTLKKIKQKLQKENDDKEVEYIKGKIIVH